MVGFSYGAVLGLIEIADQYWGEIDGACARYGVDPFALPFPRFLRLVYAWVIERVENSETGREDVEEALFGIDAMRLGHEPDSVAPEVVDEEMALFRAASTVLQAEIGRG
jgi:hypothetical protein